MVAAIREPVHPEPYSAAALAGSGCAIFGLDAMLAEQGMKALDFLAELAELLGQGRQVRVRGCPLLLAGGLLSKQPLFPVAQRRGPLVLLGVRGGRAGPAGPPGPPVQ